MRKIWERMEQWAHTPVGDGILAAVLMGMGMIMLFSLMWLVCGTGGVR